MNAFHGLSLRKLLVGQPTVGRVVAAAAVVMTAATTIANDHRNNIALRMMVRQERLTHHGRGGGIVDHQYKISPAPTCLGRVIEKETSHKGLESSVVGGHFHRGDPRVRFGL